MLKVKKRKFSVIIAGDSLISINKNEELKENFIKLILQSESILCCRVSPK